MASKKLAKWGWLGLGLGWLGLGWLTRLILIFIKENRDGRRISSEPNFFRVARRDP